MKKEDKILTPTTALLEDQEVMVYSKLLQKPFNSLQELKDAEEAYKKAHEAELKAKEERKAAAEKVKEAITTRLKAEHDAKEAKTKAYKEYLTTCDAEDIKVRAAKKIESELVREFCKTYKEGFHDTIKFNDATYRYSYDSSYSNGLEDVSVSDLFARLLEYFK